MLETSLLDKEVRKHNPGENVYMGKDHTLHAKVDGVVKFQKKGENKSYVSVIPLKLNTILFMILNLSKWRGFYTLYLFFFYT